MNVIRTSAALTRAQKLTVVTRDEAKAHLRVRHDDENDLIESYIETAFDFLHGPDGWTNGYCLLAESFEFFPRLALGTIELPARPIIDATAVSFGRRASLAEDYVAFGPADYVIARQSDVGVIARLTDIGFETRAAVVDPHQYRVRFTAGHATGADVPSPLKQAIKMLAGHLYMNREATLLTTTSTVLSKQVEFGLAALAGRYRFSPDHS